MYGRYAVTFHGPQDARQVILKHDWKLAEPRVLSEGGRKYRYRFNLVLTTYEDGIEPSCHVWEVRSPRACHVWQV